MKILAHAHIKATEAVGFHDRSDLDVTVLSAGQWLNGHVYGDTDCQIKGTTPERIDFLLRLAHAAQKAADDLAGKRGRTAAETVLAESALDGYYVKGTR